MANVIICIDICCVFIAAIVLFGCLFEIKIRDRKNRMFIILCALQIAALLVDIMSWIFEGNASYTKFLYVTSFLTFIFIFVEVFVFILYISSHLNSLKNVGKKFEIIGSIYLVFSILATTVLFFSGTLFSYVDGTYYEESLIWVYYVLFGGSLAEIAFMVLRNAKVLGVHDTIVAFCYPVMPVVGLVVNIFIPGFSVSNAMISFAIELIYVMLMREQNQKSQSEHRLLYAKTMTDELTSVSNRNAYTAAMKTAEANLSYGVLFCDVNGLKYTNDNIGHEVGDRILCKTGDLLSDVFGRANVYRISGDEFVVIFKCSESEFLDGKCEQLDKKMSGDEYPVLSYGKAFGGGDVLQNLISLAEDRMYVSKAEFHKKFPELVRKGGLFRKNKGDDASDECACACPAGIDSVRKNILIADDSEIDRELLSELLKSSYGIFTAENGAEAVDIIKSHFGEISLVFLDIVMPVMDGKEFLRARRESSILSAIPVIVTTATSSADEINECLALGANDALRKPYNPDTIMSLVEDLASDSVLKLNGSEITSDGIDELTGVLTKDEFYIQAGHMLKSSPDTQFDLFISDIQNFSSINRRYGYEAGNDVLRFVGNSLRADMCNQRIYGRYEGDQFVTLMEHVEQQTDESLHQIMDAFFKNCPITDVSAKFGIYDNVPHGTPVSVLCDCCLTALRSVKHQYGKLYGKYDEKQTEKDIRETKIEQDMQRAYDEGEFLVYYQPKHNANTDELIGAEALIRWVHPELGFLSPGEFIPLFEKNGFISKADYYIWKNVCDDLRKWSDEGLPVVPVSVNSSKKDFEYENYIDTMLIPVEEDHIEHSLLHLEVTETLFSDKTNKIVADLDKFRENGFKIELDDFGSGYSSLNMLGSLPIDVVKLDMSFMRDMHDEKRNKILRACISLSKSLGFLTVAEGAENEEQHNMLRDMGCDAIQGYHYSKPLTREEFEEYLIKNKAHQLVHIPGDH